jgi:hypothetical protein
MKKLLLSIILFLGFVCLMSARQRSLTEIQVAAANVLSGSHSNAKGLGVVSATPTLSVIQANTQITVVGNKGQGFAVIANDDQFDAVQGYTDQYDGVIAPACKWYIETLNTSLENMAAKGETAEPIRKSEAVKSAVGEMLTCKWNQDEPYNNLCPQYYSSTGDVAGRYVTGCVATAMSQIMYYNKYPTVGVGSNSYRFTPEGGISIRISSIFKNNTYEWANMLDVYKYGKYTETQAAAVAQIMYDCGVSVNMQYTKDGSGAYSSDACLALRQYFNYDPNIKMFCRDYYPLSEWMNLIFKEISDGCPILYGGQSSQGGHAFVFDGYDEQGLVHVNWGWGGSSNGYFNIASLNGFSTGQDMVQVRKPMSLPYYSIWGLSGDLSCQKKTAKTFNISASSNILNLDVEAFSGTLGVIIQSTTDATKQYVAYTQQESNINAYGIDGRIYGDVLSTQTIDISTLNIPDGEYRVYLATKSTRETEWRAVRSREDIVNSYIMTVTNGILKLTDETSVWTDIHNIETSSGMIQVFDLSGRKVYQAKSADFSVSDIPANGVLVIKNGNQVTKIVK